jgi:hypothetical protein
MGMKQILVMMAVILVGCGRKEAPEPQELADIMAYLLTLKQRNHLGP